ncbi:MAG: hypothetical protein H6Q51_700 [Deltaproteobacteria bacterium]|nr:hypothetical protein [Deltaproteobacteria bacterium]
MLDHRRWDPGTSRDTQGGYPGAGLDQQGVDVPVVAAVELDDLVSPRMAAGQAKGAHGRLRT